MKEKIAIIGSGNMGRAIAQGLLSKKIISQDQITLTNTKTRNNKEAVARADIVILAVKPQMAGIVLNEIKDTVGSQLIISIMAGITIEIIQQSLGKKIAVVRVMPNLAAKIGQSMSVWVKSKEVTEEHETVVKAVLETIGIQLELSGEEQINIATAVSGSGPAYFFYFAEIIEKTAEKLGFSREQARILTTQTLLGSADLLQKSQQATEELRLAVTSKGGTTEAAIQTFQENRLQEIVEKGMLAAFTRAQELGKKVGK